MRRFAALWYIAGSFMFPQWIPGMILGYVVTHKIVSRCERMDADNAKELARILSK